MSTPYNPDTYSKCLDDHSLIIRNALGGIHPDVFYSVYDTDPETGDPINNLNEVAIEGKCIMHAKAETSDGMDFYSPVLENPTWLEIAVFANAMIVSTRDFHHCFLERVYPTGTKNMDDIPYYTFSMGS